jgi:CAAX prenyl protease-like protein
MTDKSRFFVGNKDESTRGKGTISRARSLIEVGIVFALIVGAVWTPQGRLNALLSICASACVIGFAMAGPWDSHDMGLTRPSKGAVRILLIGSICCAAIWIAGTGLRFAGAGYPIPWSRSWQYAIWALVQEFILQSIFFVRLEAVFGSSRAVLLATALYAAAHVPSPLLTLLAFLGGLIFCKSFQRWRNIYPIGAIHAALGLTIAANLPDKWLHHMRVGIGYLALH